MLHALKTFTEITLTSQLNFAELSSMYRQHRNLEYQSAQHIFQLLELVIILTMRQAERLIYHILLQSRPKKQQEFASFSSVWVGVARKGLVICRYISRQPGKHFLDWLIVLRPLFPPPSISSGLSAGALIFCHKNQAGMFLFTSNQNLGNLFSQENLFLLICVKVPRKVVQYSLTRRSIYGVTIWDRVSCFISVE